MYIYASTIQLCINLVRAFCNWNKRCEGSHHPQCTHICSLQTWTHAQGITKTCTTHLSKCWYINANIYYNCRIYSELSHLPPDAFNKSPRMAWTWYSLRMEHSRKSAICRCILRLKNKKQNKEAKKLKPFVGPGMPNEIHCRKYHRFASPLRL